MLNHQIRCFEAWLHHKAREVNVLIHNARLYFAFLTFILKKGRIDAL